MKTKKISILLSFILATTFNLFAQDSPNGIEIPTPGVDDVITLQNTWLTYGNYCNASGSTIGTKNSYPLYFITKNANRMIIDTLGNIGIGTLNPRQMLHVVDGNIMISRTSKKAPGSTNGSILFGAETNNNTAFGRWGIEYLNQDGATGLNFWQPSTSNSNVNNYVLFLKDNGNIGIGTYNPHAKLAVNGEILAKSVRVSTVATYWPDYVFSPDYELMSLNELENYITENKHLPGIISAVDIEKQGDVDLGEMNTKLLEKIEELTLYIINLQKQIDELKK